MEDHIFQGLWGDIIINESLFPEDSSVNTENLYMDECGEVSVYVCVLVGVRRIVKVSHRLNSNRVGLKSID